MTRRQVIKEEARELAVVGEFDVVVAGGGAAGLGAAVAAGREGAKTLLIERNSFFGGNATAGLMINFTIDAAHTRGFAREMVDRLVKIGGAKTGRAINFDPEAYKQVALDCVLEAGVQPLLYTSAVLPYIADGVVRGVIVENKSGRQALLSRVVIDCTGDADLAVRAGASSVVGRESDAKTMPMTLTFRLGNVDVRSMVEYARNNPKQFQADPGSHVLDIDDGVVRICGFYDLVEEARQRGEVDRDCHYLRFEGVNPENGTLMVNTTRIYDLDGSDAIQKTRAELEGRSQVMKLVKFIRSRIPGCSRAFLIDVASNIGVRESRRIVGDCTLDVADPRASSRFPDTIYTHQKRGPLVGEGHNPDRGEGSKGEAEHRTTIYDLFSINIPYRCLLPKGIDNLLVAGRAISATHRAIGWVRSMYSQLVVGQAAGVAASLSARAGVKPREVDVAALRSRLIALGVRIEE